MTDPTQTRCGRCVASLRPPPPPSGWSDGSVNQGGGRPQRPATAEYRTWMHVYSGNRVSCPYCPNSPSPALLNIATRSSVSGPTRGWPARGWPATPWTCSLQPTALYTAGSLPSRWEYGPAVMHRWFGESGTNKMYGSWQDERPAVRRVCPEQPPLMPGEGRLTLLQGGEPAASMRTTCSGKEGFPGP